MSFTLITEPIPLSNDADGVIRISGTRVTLDSIVGAYLNGLSADSISEQFPTIPLADIHAVLSYYSKAP